MTAACFKIISFFILFWGMQTAKAQNIYDAAHSWKYAQHLYQQNDYAEAAKEYLRVLKLQPDNREALDSVISVLRKTEDYRQISALLNTHFKAGEIPAKYQHILIKAALKTEQINTARIQINRLSHSFPKKAATYKTALQILTGEYKKAADTKFGYDSEPISKLKKIADSCQAIRFKRPAFYAASAALIPGSGHIAAGNSEMGMQYLFMFAAAGFQAYKAYEIKGKADKYAFVFSGIAFGIYLGNIYGAYREAVFKNNETQEKIKKQVYIIINDIN
jgi:tetratricopeptide (TPR) repeat protein